MTQSLNFPRKPQNNVQLAPHRRRRSGSAPAGRGVWIWTAIGYLVLLVVVAGGFLWIRYAGARLEAPPAAASTTSSAADHPGSSGSEILLHVLLALAAVIALGQILARLFAKIISPP